MKVLKRRRKRVHGQSSSQLIYVLGALLLLVIAQISVSMKLLHKLTSDDESLLSNNPFIHTIKDKIQSNNDDHHQQMVILAGPHKTGTSSIETNLWLWTQKSYNFTIPEAYKSSTHHKVLNDWVWPVPEEVGRLEMANTAWDWTPAKGFYPMVEVLLNPTKKLPPQRFVFQKYSRGEIIDMYREKIEYYWNQNLNVVFGSESMDNIVKVSNGTGILKAFSKDIIPQNVDPKYITVVVAYRTPKVKHLISMWHQNIMKPGKENKISFYDWITKDPNTLGPMDALGMVEMFLEHTEWKVALLDLEGLRVNEWDESNLVACKILQGKCSNRTLTDVSDFGEMKEPIITNVRKHEQEPNVPLEALVEMEGVLRSYDCNYYDMLQRELNGDRLKIYYPIGLDETMKFCPSMMKTNHLRQSRLEMKALIKDIVVKHGRLKLDSTE